MKIVGISTTRKEDRVTTTLYVTCPFDSYYNSPENGRSCQGEKVDSIYVGEYDCKNLKLGTEIEVYYDKAISSKNGVYQQIKLIQPISK